MAKVTLSPSCSEEDISKKAHREEEKLLGNSASFSVLAFIFIHFNNKVFEHTETRLGPGNMVIATSIGRFSAPLSHNTLMHQNKTKITALQGRAKATAVQSHLKIPVIQKWAPEWHTVERRFSQHIY